MNWMWVIPVVLTAGVLSALLWRPLRLFGREVQAERARELFRLQRERLESLFIQAAAATGKPRGLRWKDCTFEESLRLARDRESQQIVALVSVTIQFEAVEGSDMEGLPAVGNLREASAVFFFQRGQWQTAGQTVFNMNPDEALDHFKKRYERLTSSDSV